MTDVNSIISQLEQQKAAIDRAITALRVITASSPGPRPASSTRTSSKESKAERDVDGSSLKGRIMTHQQKRAISRAWTPERKKRFAEFHVQRTARQRGENPAKALRDYRRRKQREQAGAGPTAKASGR